MTVSSSVNKRNVTADGTITAFTYTFRADNDDDIEVYHDGTLQSSGYTLVRESDNLGGTITFGTAPANGVVVSILRALDLTQNIDYVAFDAFPADTHELALDKLTLICQQLQEAISRAIIASIATDEAAVFTLPPYEAGKGLMWSPDTQQLITSNDNLNAVIGYMQTAESAADASEAAQLASEVARDASVAARDASQAARDDSQIAEAAAVVAQLAAEAAENAAIVARNKAEDWADEAEDVPVESGQFSAKHHAIKSAASAGASSTSATNSENSAIAADISETNALASEVAAALSFDNFDVRYLGAKTDDPTLDNSDGALIAGALYFNSTVPEMRVYNGTAWESAANIDKATTAQAEAGTDDAAYMTPLKTEQHVNQRISDVDIYAKPNILGTVSQSAGVPTGAIIERGSNANGEYVKYADGMMICTSPVLTHDVATAAGNVFRVNAEKNWTLPAAFIDTTYVVGVGTQGSSIQHWGSGRPSSTSLVVFTLFAVSSQINRPAILSAVGRWF